MTGAVRTRSRMVTALFLGMLLAVACSESSDGKMPPAEPGLSMTGSEGAAGDSAVQATGPSGTAGNPSGGVVSAEVTEVPLSPRAQVYAEKFKCACGCGHFLAECLCRNTPGSVDMKQYLQTLVDQGLSPAEVERAMVERYGPAILP